MGTRGAWAIAFLTALGNTTPNDKTVNLVSAWTKGENTEAKYNPLATTLDYGTNTKFNNCCGGNGVKNYQSTQQGIEATVMTLQGNHPGYADIVTGLKTNNPELALSGMRKNIWGTNFNTVELFWRTQDVRNETLLSEDSTPTQNADVPIHTPLPIRPGDYNNGGSGINPLGPEASTNAPGGYYDNQGDKQSTPVSANGVRKYVLFGTGIVLASLSIILFIKVAAQSDTAKSAINIAKVATL